MRNLALILFLFLNTFLYSQYNQVKFSEGTYENGMLYPIVMTPSSPEVAKKINEHLQLQIADLKSSDFCIGQFGFVQKIDFLQIHIFCNCIDFSESQNRYFLYNVSSGDFVNNMNIIGEKKAKKFTSFFNERVTSFVALNNLELNEEQINLVNTNQLDSFNVTFSKDGINLFLNDGSWGKKSLYISWIELKPFMDYN